MTPTTGTDTRNTALDADTQDFAASFYTLTPAKRAILRAIRTPHEAIKVHTRFGNVYFH